MAAENDQARLRGALETAYAGMHGADDALPPEFNALRERIALLVREPKLRKESVIDRGLSSTNSRALRSRFEQTWWRTSRKSLDLLQARGVPREGRGTAPVRPEWRPD